jgi:glucose-1-phosphate adenylyltransferase
MDVRQMVDYHIETGAQATVAAIPVPVAEARAFGVIEADVQGRIVGFEEKPAAPREMPGRPGYALASMGNYIFTTTALIGELDRDAEEKESSQHDFGRNILPGMVERGEAVFVYDFMKNEIPGAPESERGYWRDVGTIESYFEANMDFVNVTPIFDLYNARWPVRTWTRPLAPAKFIYADEESARMGLATDSLVSEGCIISGGRIHRSVLSPNVRINSFAHVENSILLEGVSIGRYARLRKTIVDKRTVIPPRTDIGFDLEADRRRFHVSESGIVVVPKEHRFE